MQTLIAAQLGFSNPREGKEERGRPETLPRSPRFWWRPYSALHSEFLVQCCSLSQPESTVYFQMSVGAWLST